MKRLILLVLSVASASLMGCWTGRIEMGDPQWNPPVISKEGCPNLDGKYKAPDNLLMRLLTQHDQLSIDKNQLLVRQPIYRRIPEIVRDKDYFARLGVVGENAVRSARARDSAEQEQAFHDRAVTWVRQQGRELEVTLTDGAGIEYSKRVLNLDHPQVGCHNGALVIRSQTRHFGAEFTKGEASAGEKEYRKSSAGGLEVIGRSRYWTSTMASEPRRKESTLLFPPAP